MLEKSFSCPECGRNIIIIASNKSSAFCSECNKCVIFNKKFREKESNSWLSFCRNIFIVILIIFAEKSTAGGEKLAQESPPQKRESLSPNQAETETADKKLLADIVANLLKQDFQVAMKQYTNSPQKNAFPELKTVLTELLNLNQHLCRGFQSRIGKKTLITTKKKKKKFIVKAADDKAIQVEESIGKTKITFTIPYTELSSLEKIKRIKSMPPVPKSIFIGLVALEWKKFAAAKKRFAKTGCLAEILISHAQEMQKNAEELAKRQKKDTARWAAKKGKIVYVSKEEGSGKYRCDGVDDHVQINRALNYVATHHEYSTVHLKGPATYWISDTIYISSNTTLEGDSDAVIRLVDNARWNTKFKPLIGQKGMRLKSTLGHPNTKTKNITIRGFEISGGNQTEPTGHSYYTMIQLQNCYNVTINDMYLHNCRNDIIRFINDKIGKNVNSRFFNNRIHHSGHDGLYIMNVNKFRIYNNIITGNRTNSGIRVTRCDNYKIYNNIIGNNPNKKPSGGAAIMIESSKKLSMKNVEIYNNFLYGNHYWHGIWLGDEGSKALNTHINVRIHNNIIFGYKEAGIAILGFHNTLIDNNIILDNGGGGIVFFKGGTKSSTRGYKTIVRNNIIADNLKYGIDNRQPSIHSFILSNNYIYDNSSGPYHNASSKSDKHSKQKLELDKARQILKEEWKKANKEDEWRGDLGAYEAKKLFSAPHSKK